MIPMDLPVGPEYVTRAWRWRICRFMGRSLHDASIGWLIERAGLVCPKLDRCLVAGKSLAEVQESVQKTLRTQFRDVSADVSLSRLRGIRVYVVGDVVKPGAYDIGSLLDSVECAVRGWRPDGPTGLLRILQALSRERCRSGRRRLRPSAAMGSRATCRGLRKRGYCDGSIALGSTRSRSREWCRWLRHRRAERVKSL